MKTIYLDIFSGISGDMFIGALLDLGVEARRLGQELEKLDLEGYHLHVSRHQRGSIAGTRFEVHLESEHSHVPGADHGHAHAAVHGHVHEHAHPHDHHDHDQGAHTHDPPGVPGGVEAHGHGRTFAQIRTLIQASGLSPWVKTKAVAVFQRLAHAEGKIHGQPPEEVHFHEVGAIDSIVDIVGGCIALELLGQPRLLAGPVVEGTGTVRCAHGCFPLPAPATLEVLSARGVVLRQCDEPNELVTPTGAALLAEFAESFAPMQDLRAERVGYGLGGRENRTRPNLLRAILGETVAGGAGHDWQSDTVAVIETNLDDIPAEILGGFVEKALAAGALDVFFTPVQMKKNRPAVLLTVLCPAEEADRFSELMLRETSAFGVRRCLAERRKLPREVVTVQTRFGAVAVKVGRLDGRVVQAAPEYESCRERAAAAGVPLKEVYEAARQAVPL